jgi:transposase
MVSAEALPVEHAKYPSSKTCNECGFINQNLTLEDREWTCPKCKVEHDRDYNASVNILNEGSKTLGTRGIAYCPDVRPSDRQLVG